MLLKLMDHFLSVGLRTSKFRDKSYLVNADSERECMWFNEFWEIGNALQCLNSQNLIKVNVISGLSQAVVFPSESLK